MLSLWLSETREDNFIAERYLHGSAVQLEKLRSWNGHAYIAVNVTE